MKTNAQILADLAAGTPQSHDLPGAVFNPNACSLSPTSRPQKGSRTMNYHNLVSDVCGKFIVNVDLTQSGQVPLQWNLLGADNGTNSAAVIRAMYGIPGTVAFATDSDTAKMYPSKGPTTLTAAEFAVYLNTIFASEGAIIGSIVAKNKGGDATIFQTLYSQALFVTENSLNGNFKNTNYEFPADDCSECFNSNNDVVKWSSTGLPASVAAGFGIELPAGLKAEFSFCIIGTGVAQNVETCD